MKKFLATAAAVVVMGWAGVANAAYITTLSGNDCAGVFGSPFEACVIPTTYDPNQSPVIAKFDVDPESFTANPLFPSISNNGSEWAFTGLTSTSGTWTYTPGANDPLITFVVVKGGNFFALFSAEGPNSNGVQTGTWFTPTNQQNGNGFGLSHITFYDTGTQVVPEPASMLLLGAGLLGLATQVRRRK